MPQRLARDGLWERSLAVGHGWHDLLKRALTRFFVGSPTHELGPVAEAIAGDVIETNFDDEFWSQRLPFPRSLCAPAAWPARSLSGKTWRLAQRFEPSRQRLALVVRDC